MHQLEGLCCQDLCLTAYLLLLYLCILSYLYLYPHMEGLLVSEISNNLISTANHVKGVLTPIMKSRG